MCCVIILSAEKQAQIRKMSDARLISNLSKMGQQADDIEKPDRQGLLDAYAKSLLEGRDRHAEANSSVNIYLEREKLAFEREKLAFQKEEDEKDRLFLERKRRERQTFSERKRGKRQTIF